MIRSIAWSTPNHYGVLVPGGESYARPAPTPDEIIAVVGRPVKYFSRMTRETRSCLCAASVALRAISPLPDFTEIGVVSAGAEACIKADEDYFRDYVSSGRSMGRGNLFIYTLPTSTLGEVAIALSLTGPAMYLHADHSPLASLMRQADQLIADGEAGIMLALWSDSEAAVCVTIEAGEAQSPPIALRELPPLQLANQLRDKVQSR
jgi:hypothetical protein